MGEQECGQMKPIEKASGAGNGMNALRAYQLKVLAAMRDNFEAMFECANEMVQAKSPSELFELSTKYSQRQFAIMGKQANELVGYAQNPSGQPGTESGQMS
jgi:hypothetical protein